MRRYSYSQISTYAACPLKFRLHYQDNLTPLSEGGRHDLDFGSAMHDALAVFYSGGDTKTTWKAFSDSYPRERYPDPLPLWSQGKSYTGGMDAIAAYAKHYEEDDQHWEVLSVERMRVMDTDEEKRLVKLDLVVRDSRDGLVYGVDHKVTGRYLDASYFSAFDPHSQVRQYVDHLQQKYGECGGFYINALSLKHRSKAYTPRQGPDKGVQLPAGDWCAFGRRLFNPNAEAVEAERASFAGWVSRIEHSQASSEWPYNTDQCVRGPIVCEYHRICSAGYQWPRDRELIEAYYRERCIRLASNGERCWLEPGHKGEHNSTRPVASEPEVDLNDEIEDAEQ